MSALLDDLETLRRKLENEGLYTRETVVVRAIEVLADLKARMTAAHDTFGFDGGDLRDWVSLIDAAQDQKPRRQIIGDPCPVIYPDTGE